MGVVDTTLINCLGKKVSFSISNDFEVYSIEGIVTDVLISINSKHEISIDHGDFYSFSELIDFNTFD